MRKKYRVKFKIVVHEGDLFYSTIEMLCKGRQCDKCSIRFRCFTTKGYLEVDGDELGLTPETAWGIGNCLLSRRIRKNMSVNTGLTIASKSGVRAGSYRYPYYDPNMDIIDNEFVDRY